MKIEQGKKIKMEYELKIEGGDVLESSASLGPLEFVHGAGRMLPALEKRIEGMTVGEEGSGVIPSLEVCGPEESRSRQLKRDEFPEGAEIEVGKNFEAKSPAGEPVTFRVKEIGDELVTVVFTHPLEGKDLRYSVKILEVSDVD